MGKINCINRKSKEFKDLKSNLSKALRLTDITVTDETLLDVIDLFAADNNITEADTLDRIEELSKYIEDYFGFNTKYTPDSEVQEEYDEWFNDNIDYINTPYTPTEETDEFENTAKIVTEEKAKVVNLSNGQKMVVIPNSPLPAIAKEMQEIKEKAITDGTFMKAPNGQPTNLTEQQWLQVRTKSFKEWFGDWENDPENASKAVDENGEPKVVWRASRYGKKTDYDVFDLEKTGGQGFYFANKEAAEKWYGGDNMRAFFLNLRNPDTSNNFNILQSEAKYFDENDGVIFAPKGTEDITFEVKVFSPNQIKSATDNRGTFSKIDNNIYHNKTLNELPSVIDLIKDIKPYVNHGSRNDKSDKTLLVQRGNSYFLNYDSKNGKEGLSQVTAMKALAREMEKLGLESDYIGVNPDTGIVYAKTRKYPIEDRITAFEESEDLYKNSEQHQQALSVLDFLSEKTGLKYKFITKEEAAKLVNVKELNDNVNAFCLEDTAYFIKGKDFNTDIAAEEMLHPFVNSIRISNPEAFESLLNEAKTSFPALALQIDSTYVSNKEEELVTQALSRAFRKDYEENPNHNSIKELIRKFFEAIKNWFSNADLPWVDSEGNITDKLYATDLSKTITLENLASIINTEIELGNANFINQARANKLTPTPKSKSKIVEINKKWTRNEVAKDSKNLYIFTDNIDRDSGKRLIDPKSKYAKKYGKDKHYPTMTQAVIRGLDNAMPISTQRFYHEGVKGENGRWTDVDFAEFKITIDEEIEAIKKEWESGKYKNLVIGSKDGFFNTEISNITKKRTPKIYEYLENKLNELYNFVDGAVNKTSSKNKPTLEDRVAEIEEMISAFDRTIIKDKDFAENHKYYIKTDKGSKLVDISVTALNAELLGEKFENKKGITYPQGHIGNSFDALVRDYFNGGITTQVYPNFNRRNIERLTKQLDQFVKQLDEAFGKGKYKVITKDWSLGGYVTINGKKKSVAGSIDMMVVTESGDIYIYDMKTTSKDISSNINKYTGQLTFYKELIGINYPEIANRIKGVGLLVCDINFGRKFGSTNYGKYSIKKGTKDQLLFDGSEIQKEAGHINPIIQTNNTGIGGFILDLQSSQAVEDLKMYPLNMQKVETEEDFVAKETQKSLFEKGNKKVDVNDELDKLGTVKEKINTDAGLNPVSDVEIAYLGSAIMKLMSKYLDLLNLDDNYRVDLLSNIDGTNDYAEDYFTSIDREAILTSDVFHKLLEYIKYTHFDAFDESVEPGSAIQDKLLWINDNFNAIVNSGFATLVAMEKVALTMTKDTTGEHENEEITRQFEEEEREESQQMAFDIDSKEKSYMDSIPSKLKNRLSKIYKRTYDDNGNSTGYVYDEYGYQIPTFEEKHYVVNTIMSLVHGCTSISSMLEVLENNETYYPWLKHVISMIRSDRELKTQFFRTFRKNATLYNKLYLVEERDQDGNVVKTYFRSEPLSIRGKLDKLVDNANINIESNNASLFSKESTGVVSIDSEVLEEFKTNVTKLSKILRPQTKDIKILRKVLESLGFDNTDSLNVLKDKKYNNEYKEVIKSLSVLSKKLSTLEKKGKPFPYNSEIGKNLYFVAQNLTVTMNDEYEISVYDGGKSRMTYTEPTALQTLIETLGNRNPGFSLEDALRVKYGKYAQFVNDNGYISSWLEELEADSELQDWIKHSIRTTFDDTTYLEQNDAQYALSLMLDYASPRIKGNKHSIGTKLPLAFFRVPIMSDKNSSESILFKTYALEYNDNEAELAEMKKTIADKMHQFFLQEIKRMRSIYEHIWNDAKGDVEFYHLSRTPEVEKIKAKGKGNLTVEDFLQLRKQKRFNGFTFHYTPMFNAAMESDSKFAQMVVDAINGKKTTGLRKKYDKIFIEGVESRFENWKANVEATIPGLDKQLSASLDFIRTIPNAKSDELSDYEAFLQEYYWNDYLATCNIYNLTIIDPAFNKDVTDLQKRFAQVHSATIKCDTEATFIDEYGIERRYSDGTFRFVILDDLSRGSSLKEDIKKVFLDAAKKAEKTDTKRAKELRILASTIPNEFDKIDFTDGQGYSSPTGFWKKLSMLGEQDSELQDYVFTLKDNLDKIAEGDFSLARFDMVKQAFKPFVFGHSPHINDNTVMGEYLVPTQIKDSEAMLVLAGAILRNSEQNHPLTAIFEFMENSHWKVENGRRVYQDDGIDTVVFHSAVKQGAYGVVNINDAKSKEEALEKLNNALVHKLPYDSWGKQTEVPEHFQDHTQGMGSQQRILSVTDIADDAILEVNGKPYTKQQFLKKYFTLISEDMREGINEVEKLLNLKGNRLQRNKALSELLVKAVVKDAKYTDTLRKAFTLNDAGEFDIPLGDPTIADKFFSVLFSLVKNNVNLQKFPGGPTVQMSVYGMDEYLGIKYLNPKEKTGMYCEAMVTCPTQELEDRITVTNKNIKDVKVKFKNKYKVGDMLDVDDAIKSGYMSKEEAEFIFNRIPTEDKYSLWACKVKRFLPRQMGEFVILPKETLKASGYDLDIDKGFLTFRFFNPKTNSQRRKNEIFDFQWTSLLHNGTLEKSFNPGSFDILKDLAKQVDPNFGSNDISLMFLDGQYYYRHNNAAGKQYVGIAALNNTCHGMCNMAGVGFKSMFDFKVNGISSLDTFDENTQEYRFDTTNSIYDGTRVSRTLGMFVGAAADNAKDAVLASVGCTPTTATFVNGMIRMGIPLGVVVGMMTNPTIKELIKKAEFEGKRFEEIIANTVEESMEEVYNTLSKTNFTEKQLIDRISKGKNKELDKKVLYFLKAITPYAQAIADTNNIMSLNSTKNSVGPDVYNTVQKEIELEYMFDNIENGNSVLGDSCKRENLIKNLPFLKELIECYDTLIPKIAKEYSPIYQGEFKAILKKLKGLGFWVDDKFIKQTYNAYLIYRATALEVIDGSYQGRKSTIFETPLHVFKDKQSVENTFLAYLNVKKQMNKKTAIPTVAGVNTGLTTEFRDMLSAHWTALSKDERTKELSDLITEHFLFKFGFMFNPSSPLTMLSSYNKLNFKNGNYGDIFKEVNDVENINNFIVQYARNNPKTSLWNSLSKDDFNEVVISDKSGKLKIDSEKLSHNEKQVGVRYGYRLFVYEKSVGTTDIYREVTSLGIDKNFLEYNGAVDGTEMESVITPKNKNFYSSQYKMLISEESEKTEDFEVETPEGEDNADKIKSTNPNIYDNPDLEELLSKKEYKTFKSKVAKKEEGVLYEIWQKLRRDSVNKKEYQELLKALKEVC